MAHFVLGMNSFLLIRLMPSNTFGLCNPIFTNLSTKHMHLIINMHLFHKALE